MSKSQIIFLLVSFLLAGCQSKSNEREKESRESDKVSTGIPVESIPENIAAFEQIESYNLSLADYQISSAPDSVEVLEITEGTIVAIGVSDRQIEYMKSEYGEEDFYIVADDNNWYSFQFGEMLDSLPYQVVRPDERFLRFVWNESEMLIDLEKEGRKPGLCWDYILFNGMEQPKLVEDIVIPNPTAIVEYMENGRVPSIFTKNPGLWNRPSNSIDQLIQFSEKNGGLSDEKFAEFLDLYVETIDQLNDILFEDEDFEVYEELAYTDTKYSSNAIRFKQRLEELGMQLRYSEGSISIEQNTDYVSRRLGNFFTERMKGFFHSYSMEVNYPLSEDGGLAVRVDDVVDRLAYWEDFNKENPNFVMSDYVMGRIEVYIYVLLNGLDNTPAFEYDGGMDQYFLEAYEYAIEMYPKSTMSTVLKEYLKLLQDSDFEKTSEVKRFLSRYDI